MPARHVFRPKWDFTARAARPNASPSCPPRPHLARRARPARRRRRQPCHRPRAGATGRRRRSRGPARRRARGRSCALRGPRRRRRRDPHPGAHRDSLAAQVQAILDVISDPPPDRTWSWSPVSRSGTASQHALNTPERLADRRRAEELVRRSGVPYTIVRPTWLTNDPPGRYAVTLTQDPLRRRDDRARRPRRGVPGGGRATGAQGTTFAVFAQPGPAPGSWAPLFSALDRDAWPDATRGPACMGGHVRHRCARPPVPPRFHRLVMLDVTRTPAPADAMVPRQCALRRLEDRHSHGPDGLLMLLGWGPGYFARHAEIAAPCEPAVALGPRGARRAPGHRRMPASRL